MSLVIERSSVETKSVEQSTTQARDIYDPQYDPLKDSSPGYGRNMHRPIGLIPQVLSPKMMGQY